MSYKVGTKLQCTKCGSEFIVTKSTTPAFTCCNQEVQQK